MNRLHQVVFALALWWPLVVVSAGPLQLPAQPAARFDPAPGSRLPLDAVLRDEQGAGIALGALFGRVPVVLVPGYYTCPNLCSTTFEGVLQALALSGLTPGSYRLAGVSIDPRDGAPAALARRAAYAALLPGGASSLRMLTGDAAALARLQRALGYRAVPDQDSGELAHVAGFVVADPEGRIAATFTGVRFDPAALRGAVLAAAAHRVAPDASLAERLQLLCAHYDPEFGRNSAPAMAVVRAVLLLAAFGLAAWLWRQYRAGGRP